MSKIVFHKMHGLGNDYIYVNLDKYPITDISAFSRKYSDRRFGIGGDGVITYQKELSGIADYRMRVFNLDGSEATMCGNAIRCVAKLLYEDKLCCKNVMRISTLSGVKVLELEVTDDVVEHIKVDMNPPKIHNEHMCVKVGENEICGVHVDVGNPHFVHFIDLDPDAYPLHEIGPQIEHHKEFGAGANYEVVYVLSSNHVKMRVWERGSGLTMACGTGATAIAVGGIATGRLESPVRVTMPGGDLTIEWDGQQTHSVYMIGGATLVYEGVINDFENRWLPEV